MHGRNAAGERRQQLRTPSYPQEPSPQGWRDPPHAGMPCRGLVPSAEGMADDRDGQGERWLVHLASLGLLAARPPEVCSTRRLSTLTANELPAGGRAMKVDVVSLLRQHGSEPFFLQRDQRCAVLSHDLREAIIRRPLAWA